MHTREPTPPNCESSSGANRERATDLWLVDLLSCSSLSVLTDLNINKVSLDTSLFPGAPGNAQVHQGFRDAHKATANDILAEVRNLLNSNGASSVVVVRSPSGFLGG